MLEVRRYFTFRLQATAGLPPILPIFHQHGDPRAAGGRGPGEAGPGAAGGGGEVGGAGGAAGPRQPQPGHGPRPRPVHGDGGHQHRGLRHHARHGRTIVLQYNKRL